MVIVLKKRGKNSKMKMVISSKNTNKYAKEERKMIIMDLKIDNFLAFKNFHMNICRKGRTSDIKRLIF